MLPLLMAAACAPPEAGEACRLSSTVPTYTPACAALIVFYPDQARVLVDDRLEVQVGPDPQPGDRFGGASGAWMAALLDGEVADARSTMTIGPTVEEIALDLIFAAGTVEGVVLAEPVHAETP